MRRDDLRIEALPTPPARLGESPVWLPESDEVLWVDMPAGLIHRTERSTGSTRTIETPTYLGAVAPAARGGYVAASREGFAMVTGDGHFVPLWSGLPAGHRMNDAQCDPLGRLVAGSLHFDFTPGEGRLWSLTEGEEPRLILEGLTQPNGLAWSTDGATFYLIDSANRELNSFQYNVAEGTITGRRLLRTFGDTEGYADGMTVDLAGCLLVALWGAGEILRIAPDGSLLATISVPVRYPTSCVFAGKSTDQLVVTSAAEILGDGGSSGGDLLILSGLPIGGLVKTKFGQP